MTPEEIAEFDAEMERQNDETVAEREHMDALGVPEWD